LDLDDLSKDDDGSSGRPLWLLINTSAASLSNVPLPGWIQTLAAWLVVFGSALPSGWLVSLLFRAHRGRWVLPADH
jgi:hypothetical protein